MTTNAQEFVTAIMAQIKPVIDESLAVIGEKITALEMALSRHEAAAKQQARTDDKPDAFTTPIVELFGDDAVNTLQRVQDEFGTRARYETELFLRCYAHATEIFGRIPTREEQRTIFKIVKANSEAHF
ncbi:hypothetical protein [Brucella intermedia]|uniref:hypothetical protein n=1 Tax=Brucella intermedia TaxID=94625 RepID=UPI00124EC794|nr:hypothetical protein [Brucella intermedia]KAB2716976.1 hypothetical protein F9K75_12975 [Brucella intermedia]